MKAVLGSKLFAFGFCAACLVAMAACDTTNEDADATTGGTGGTTDNRTVVTQAIGMVDDLDQEDILDCNKSTVEGNFAPGADIAGVAIQQEDGTLVFAGSQAYKIGQGGVGACTTNNFDNASAVLGSPGDDFLSLNGGILTVEFENSTPARVGDSIIIYTSTKTQGSRLDRVEACANVNGLCEPTPLAQDIAATAGGTIELTLSDADVPKADMATTF